GVPVSALGSLTVSWVWTRMGVSTMKMITRMSATSISGTRFISAMTLPRSVSFMLLVGFLGQRLEDLFRQPAHLLEVARRPAVEVVVRRARGDGDQQARGRADQRFRDADGHDAGAGAGRARQVLEGAHDADHRAEEADERRRAGHGAQQGHALEQL